MCLTLCNPMGCSTPGFPPLTTSWSLLRLMSIESVMPPNHLILCHPLLLLPSIFPSIRVFSNESAIHIRWPKYWSFSLSISPSNEYLGFVSFRTALAVQGTLTSLLQHHSSKASVLQHSASFMVQILDCVILWKNVASNTGLSGTLSLSLSLPLFVYKRKPVGQGLAWTQHSITRASPRWSGPAFSSDQYLVKVYQRGLPF